LGDLVSGSSHVSNEASGGVGSVADSGGSNVSNSGGGHVGDGRGLSVGNSGDDVGLLSVHGNVDGLVEWEVTTGCLWWVV